MNRISIIFIILLTTSCIGNKQSQMQVKLATYDNLLNSNPQAAYDSLEILGEQSLNKKNRAYFNLLYTIASDKINKPFISDSIINKAYSWYKERQATKTAEQYNKQNLIKAALYSGIVKYNINNRDSSAYHCLKEAQVLADANKMTDNNTLGLITFYLGDIQNTNKCYKNAADYYNRASDYFAKSNQDENYILAKIAYINTLYSLGDSNKAITTLDYLENYKTNSIQIKYNIYEAISTFYSSIKEYQKALDYRLKCIQYDSLPNRDKRANLLAMAKYYLHLNNQKEAVKYTIMLDSVLSATIYPNNYEYLNELSGHYLKLNREQKSLEYKMKAYEDLEHLYLYSIIQTSNKYENLYKTLQSKLIGSDVKNEPKNLVFYVIIVILAFALCAIISTFIIILKKEKRYLKQILSGRKQLDTTINLQLHSIIKQISSRNANFIDSAPSQIQAIEDDTSRKITRKLFENYKKEYKQAFFKSIPHMPGKEKLSDQEKAVDYLNSLKFSEHEIADIILTSRTGISTYKNRIHDKTCSK